MPGSGRVFWGMIPKSGYRFSDKIMLETKNLDRDPIRLDCITVCVRARKSRGNSGGIDVDAGGVG